MQRTTDCHGCTMDDGYPASCATCDPMTQKIRTTGARTYRVTAAREVTVPAEEPRLPWSRETFNRIAGQVLAVFGLLMLVAIAYHMLWMAAAGVVEEAVISEGYEVPE